MFTQTEQSTTDQRTPNLSTPCPLFPSGTKLIGPVVVLQKVSKLSPSNRPMVMLSHKLIFEDGTEIVIAAECRQLWAGQDGAAFDAAPSATWQIASALRAGIIVNHGLQKV
jgi:hypothetical protein